MSLIRPKGKFTFSAAKLDDGTTIDPSVVSYNFYGAPSAPDFVPEDLKFSVPAVTDQATYEIDLADVPGLLGANGETYMFAVAAVDGAGNVADYSNRAEFPLDEKAPNAIADFAYTAE